MVLDEFTYLLNYGMVGRDEALKVLSERPEGLHVAVTGRDASGELTKTADLVSDQGRQIPLQGRHQSPERH